MATQNRHLTPKKTTLDEAIATDIAINIIAIQYLKFFLKKLSKNVATCLTLTAEPFRTALPEYQTDRLTVHLSELAGQETDSEPDRPLQF